MTSYPASAFTWVNRVDYVDIYLAADPNSLAAEIIAIQADLLGTGVAGGLKQAAASFYANWTAEHTTAGLHRFTDGAAATPSITFASDTNTGLYNYGADAMGISANGSANILIRSTYSQFPKLVYFDGVVQVSDGTAAAPGVSFQTDTDTGLYKSGGNMWGLSGGGTASIAGDNVYIYVYGQLYMNNAAPAIFDSSTNEYLKFVKTASAVNELTITNAATTAAPSISATGNDTNIDILFTPKGSGNVKFGTYTVGAATDSTGYITIKDSGGTARKLMVQA